MNTGSGTMSNLPTSLVAQVKSFIDGAVLTIETNNNIRSVQSKSSKFASLLFDQIPNRRVVGTDWKAVC